MFQENNAMFFAGVTSQQRGKSTHEILQQVIDRHGKLHEFYVLLSQLCLIAIERKLRLIVENPATQPHYLNLYWCVKPSLIDKDRRDNGDYYKKPTQYWFFNCKPENNMIFEPLQDTGKTWVIDKIQGNGTISREVMRSMIHPQYAERFIKQHIIDYGQPIVAKENTHEHGDLERD